ncbi:tetratricopeptide repeat protein [Aestuariivirga sp.]|uniref:tetratricopeptide repeat protein n=1 Tax=Aestuariivirga sp. TaxID=2650926 RepID=UPI0039E4499C
MHALRITLLALALSAAPALAQQSPADPPAPQPAAAATPAAPAKSPSQLREEELDRLFGLLHGEGAEARAATVEKRIWATWGRSDSVTAEVLLNQATKAMNAEEFETAEVILDRLLTVRPEFAEAWNRRATLNFLAKRYDKALADIDKVLELEPRHFGALAGRGMIYEAQGKPDQALAAYREALTMNPFMSGVKDKVQLLEKERPDI